MIIAISGAQGVGKTTILNEIKKDDLFKNFQIQSSTTRKVKDSGLKINENGNDETQREIVKLHLNNLKIKNDVFLDRCLLDCLVYTHYLYLKNQVKKETLEYVKREFHENLSKYDLICYIKPEFDIEDDNVRSTSIEFRNTIKSLFDYYINFYNLKLFYLTGTIENRLNQLKENFKYFNLRKE